MPRTLAPPPAAHRGRAWLVTALATVASTYALDAFATAAGAALTSCGVLAGAGRPLVLLLLAASYLAWAAALRVNLAANWFLVTTTGASTNALSKLAYDLAGTRLAASGGYVATELLKEVPYYAGAFGTAVVADGVSTADAIVFLIGTNVGAAAYEYGLARATRHLLSRRLALASEREVGDRPDEVHERRGDPDRLAAVDLPGRPSPEVGQRGQREADLQDPGGDDARARSARQLTPSLVLRHVGAQPTSRRA